MSPEVFSVGLFVFVFWVGFWFVGLFWFTYVSVGVSFGLSFGFSFDLFFWFTYVSFGLSFGVSFGLAFGSWVSFGLYTSMLGVRGPGRSLGWWECDWTGWRRLVGSPKLQIIFHKRPTKYSSLLQKMTYKDKGCHESLPPCNLSAPFCLCWEWEARGGLLGGESVTETCLRPSAPQISAIHYVF